MSATSQVCQDFFQDPTRNPRTGRKINKGKVTYNKLVRECGDPEQTQQSSQLIESSNIPFENLKRQFFQDPTHNPRTGRIIIIDGITYKKLVKLYGEPPSIKQFKQQHGVNPIEALINAAGEGNNEIVSQLLTNYLVYVNAKDKDSKTALMRAAQNGHNQVVSLLLEAGADAHINARNNDGWTALMLASLNGHNEVVRLLLQAGADINAKDDYGYTALRLAVMNRHNEVVRLLLQAGADVNAKNNDGNTALMYGAMYGYNQVVRLLLQAGADVNAKNNDSYTALIYAAREGHNEVVRLLLEAGADVNAKNNGRTALMYTAYHGHNDIIELLLQAGADFNAKNNDGNTTLMYAAMYGHNEVVRLLLEAGADVNAKNNDGYTALMLVTLNGHNELVSQLLEAGADIYAKDKNGNTALMLAADQEHNGIMSQLLIYKDLIESLRLAVINGNNEVVPQLLEAGANVNAKDNQYGYTALMLAVEHRNNEVVPQLLEAGANVNAKDEYGQTALMWTAMRAYVDNEHNDTALMWTAMRADNEIVRLLLQAGADVNAKDEDGKTALMYAAMYGHNDIIELLLQAGADVNAKDNDGYTALMLVTLNGHNELVSQLLEAGADINAKNEDGWTALMHAASEGDNQIVELLLEAGANVRNNDGKTALMIAAMYGDNKVVSQLLEAGADIYAKDKNGKTALMYGAVNRYGYIEVVRLLLELGANVNAKDNDGKTALMYCVLNGGSDRIVSELLKAGADVNAKDKDGKTALMLLFGSTFFTEPDSDEFINADESLLQLLKAKADINAKDNHGQTLLFTLVNSNNPQFIRRLIKAGLDPSVRDDYGKIAVDYMTNYNKEIFDMLSVVDTSMQIDPKRLEQLRTKLETIKPCDYTSFTPINIANGIYEICLDSECDYYLKVYELGESSRLDQLEKELAEKQATIGNLVNSLKGILSSINKINNIVVLIDTLIAGYPNGDVSSMEQYIDSLVDTNDKRFIEQILEFFIETIDKYKEELWITLTNGLDNNELRDQGKLNFIRRLRIKLASASKPLIEAKGRLNNYRGDFDQRKTLPDVIDSYECNYHDGKARGLIIVPKSWGYMECSNPVSLITKENWGEVENKRPIKLFIYNTELTKHDKIMCFNYDNLKKSIETSDKFLNWVPRDPSRQIEENTGMGGKPGKIKITKLPDGSHILEDSLKILESSHINYGLLPIYLNMRVGNKTGTFGVSMAHGQNKVTVYGLFKTDKNGNLLNKEKVMEYSKNVEKYNNEVKLNENINDEMLNRISVSYSFATSSLADSSFAASSS